MHIAFPKRCEAEPQHQLTKEGNFVIRKLFHSLKGALARILVRIFYFIVDPQLESELAIPDEYLRVQDIRRREIEEMLTRYLGPRL